MQCHSLCAAPGGPSLMPFDGAVAILLAHARQQTTRLAVETVSLEEATGRRSANALLSPISLPPFDQSAMDGFAVSSAYLRLASSAAPIRLRVVKTVLAGQEEGKSGTDVGSDPSTCAEITTGAKFPEHACCWDACVPYELVEEESDTEGRWIWITAPVAARANRRRCGEELEEGAAVVGPGTRITPGHVMLLASLGIDALPVLRRPLVGVISTGLEVATSTSSGRQECASAAKVHDANTPFILSALRSMGYEAVFLGQTEDCPRAFRQAVVRGQGQHCDVLVSTGGVSGSRTDHVAATISGRPLQGEVHFHGVAMRPGKPVLFASVPTPAGASDARTPFFGLPGNPLAAAATFRFLVLPYLTQWCGSPASDAPERVVLQRGSGAGTKPGPPLVEARHFRLARHVGKSMQSPDGRRYVSEVLARPGHTSKLCEADCWIAIDPGGEEKAFLSWPLLPCLDVKA